MFVRIKTHSGLHGVWEGDPWGWIEAAVADVAKLATYLEGKDLCPIEHHWDVMCRFSYFKGTRLTLRFLTSTMSGRCGRSRVKIWISVLNFTAA
jgi:L-alanine-DL-glutamate epimerase-like enolase superfamily enzyme